MPTIEQLRAMSIEELRELRKTYTYWFYPYCIDEIIKSKRIKGPRGCPEGHKEDNE
jgi:hypothetical protein